MWDIAAAAGNERPRGGVGFAEPHLSVQQGKPRELNDCREIPAL